MKSMRIRSQFLLIVLPLILCSYVILIISTNLVFYQDIVVKQQKEVWDKANIVASQIERAFTNIASCCKVISRDFNYDENKLLVTQKPKSVLEEYQKDLAIRSVLYSNEIFLMRWRRWLLLTRTAVCMSPTPGWRKTGVKKPAMPCWLLYTGLEMWMSGLRPGEGII